MVRGVARPGIVVLTAVLTELVLIAAFANQWVSDAIVRNVRDGHSAGIHELAGSWLTYTWRVSPHARDTWGSELTLIIVTVVATGLLVFAVARGPVTFGRVFFGTWPAVIAATLLGAVGRGLVDPGRALPGALRLTRAVFGDNGPDRLAAVGGFGLGLVTALLTALIAVATRRAPIAPSAAAEETASLTPYAVPEQPPPFFGDPVRQPWRPADVQPTTQLPRAPEPPAPARPAPEPPASASRADEQTAQFPRPPDDEHL